MLIKGSTSITNIPQKVRPNGPKAAFMTIVWRISSKLFHNFPFHCGPRSTMFIQVSGKYAHFVEKTKTKTLMTTSSNYGNFLRDLTYSWFNGLLFAFDANQQFIENAMKKFLRAQCGGLTRHLSSACHPGIQKFSSFPRSHCWKIPWD